MTKTHPRILREKKTLNAMIKLYCKKKHEQVNRSGELCSECQELWDYANARLDKCTYQGDKPTCAKCPIHCYKKSKRTKIQQVMRFSGPRMLGRHPILAIRHLMDSRKKVKKTE